MISRLKKIVIFVTIIIIAIGMVGTVYADGNYSCELEVTQNKTTIAPGESVTFEFKAKNIQAGNGIAMFMTKIDDDTTNCFDYFDYSVTGDENNTWYVQANYEGVITMSRNGGEASSEDTVIARITLTAKSGIEAKSYPIVFALNEFTTDDYSTITIPDVTKSIEVTANGTSQGGSEQGGTSQGGTEQGGASQGGTEQGGTSQGGTEQGGASQGGTEQGGTSQGGTEQGGAS